MATAGAAIGSSHLVAEIIAAAAAQLQREHTQAARGLVEVAQQ
jgi:hypothetical protein